MEHHNGKKKDHQMEAGPMQGYIGPRKYRCYVLDFLYDLGAYISGSRMAFLLNT